MLGAIVAVGTTLYGAKSSKKAAKSAQNSANALAQQQAEADAAALNFAKEQYEDWKNVFGDIQANLSTYYNNLSADTLAVRGLEAFETERDNALTNLRETLAQRGIGDSGLAGAVEAEMATMSATERARIRAEAPMKAAMEKASFLAAGLGQDARSNVQTVLNQQASNKAGAAATAAGLAGNAAADAIAARTAAVTSVADFLESNDIFKRKAPGLGGSGTGMTTPGIAG